MPLVAFLAAVVLVVACLVAFLVVMKLGEAANRLSRLDVLAPHGVEWALAVANRNFIIHHYDEINRELTWLTLSSDLPAWKVRYGTSSLMPR